MRFIISLNTKCGLVYWSIGEWTTDILFAHIFYSQAAAVTLSLSIGGEVVELSS